MNPYQMFTSFYTIVRKDVVRIFRICPRDISSLNYYFHSLLSRILKILGESESEKSAGILMSLSLSRALSCSPS